MAELFAGSRKRLDRAVSHAETFKANWESLIDPKVYGTSIEMNSNWTEGSVRYVRSSPLPEHELALEFGEMFYQLRAALDSLIYEASVLSEGIDPPSNENRVEFPVCIKPSKFKESTVNDSPFPNKLRDWLETIQPYNAAKAMNTPIQGFGNSLRLLHDCARKDRHRRLHVVAAIPTSMTFKFESHPGQIFDIQPIPMNLLEGKDKFLRFRAQGFTPERMNGNVKFDSDVFLEVSIDEIPLFNPGDSTVALNSLFDVVDAVVTKFEDWFR